MKAKLVFNSVGVTTHFESSVLSSGCEIEVLSPAFYSCLAWYAKIDDMIDTQLKGLRGHICYNKAIFKKSKSEISQLGDRKLIVRFSNLLSFILSSVLGYLTFQLRSYLESLENCLGRQNMTEQLLCWSWYFQDIMVRNFPYPQHAW